MEDAFFDGGGSHFEAHDNDSTSCRLEIRNQESDYQDVEIVSTPKRASRKRKRANITSTSARSTDASTSANPRFYVPVKESPMDSVLKGEDSQEDEIEDIEGKMGGKLLLASV
jgi:hypothetical protein